jgi:predicted DNA-binding transcriptional regulator YafY
MLLNTLSALLSLSRFDGSTKELMDHFGCSAVTVKRMISEARRMGANIVSTKQDDGYKYHLSNREEISAVLYNWLAKLQLASEIVTIAKEGNALTNPKSVVK